MDITFGLTDGWWKFTDSRPSRRLPLISKAGWQKLLTETGFNEITLLPPDLDSQQALLIARGPAATAEEVARDRDSAVSPDGCNHVVGAENSRGHLRRRSLPVDSGRVARDRGSLISECSSRRRHDRPGLGQCASTGL